MESGETGPTKIFPDFAALHPGYACYLRRRSMGSLGLCHKLGAPLGFQLHRENGFFQHDMTSCNQIVIWYIRFHYPGKTARGWQFLP
jgi:hypothetical protein